MFLQSDPAATHGKFATNLSVLATGKARSFALEFEEPLDNAWFRKYAAPEAAQPDAPDLHLVTATVVSLVLCNYAEFDRRILQTCLGFPLCLLNMCPEVKPDLRRSTASRLQGMARRDLDTTKTKFRENHKAEICRVAADGCCYPVCLGASLTCLRNVWLADTQEVESSNNIVVKTNEKAQQMDCELLAARLTNVKAVYQEAGESPKSKDLLAMAHSMQGHWLSQESQRLLHDRERIALPFDAQAAIEDELTKSAGLAAELCVPAPLCDTGEQLTMTDLIAEQMPLVWAAPFNLSWSRAWVKEFQVASLAFQLGGGGPLYLCCSKHDNIGSCFKLQAHGDTLTLVRPLSPTSSLDVIKSQYGNCAIHQVEVPLLLVPLAWTVDDNDLAVATRSASTKVLLTLVGDIVSAVDQLKPKSSRAGRPKGSAHKKGSASSSGKTQLDADMQKARVAAQKILAAMVSEQADGDAESEADNLGAMFDELLSEEGSIKTRRPS